MISPRIIRCTLIMPLPHGQAPGRKEGRTESLDRLRRRTRDEADIKWDLPLSRGNIPAAARLRQSFFNLKNPSNVVVVQNCTLALNIVIKGLLRNGGHVIVSDLEHKTPLCALFYAISNYFNRLIAPPVFSPKTRMKLWNSQKGIRPDTKAIICLHASNVFGTRLPIREIRRLARRHGIKFVVDAAQSAGVLPIDMQADCIDYLCVHGHKGLYGSMGIGMLLCGSEQLLPPFIEGGTGSYSIEFGQPSELPDRFESGTLNTAGICGLLAGMEFVKGIGIRQICEQETAHMRYIYNQLRDMKGISLYTPCPDISRSAPVLSFNIEGATVKKQPKP